MDEEKKNSDFLDDQRTLSIDEILADAYERAELYNKLPSRNGKTSTSNDDYVLELVK